MISTSLYKEANRTDPSPSVRILCIVLGVSLKGKDGAATLSIVTLSLTTLSLINNLHIETRHYAAAREASTTGRLRTVDHLIKIGRFVKKEKYSFSKKQLG